jgi:hypothetical protein
MSDKDQQQVYGNATSLEQWLASSLPKHIVIKRIAALLVSSKYLAITCFHLFCNVAE